MGLDNFGQTILANPLARRTNLESVLGTDVTVDFNFSEKANSVLENEITISVLSTTVTVSTVGFVAGVIFKENKNCCIFITFFETFVSGTTGTGTCTGTSLTGFVFKTTSNR